MKILVIGSGMYVNGRNTSGNGIVIPSIFNYLNSNKISSLTFWNRSSNGLRSNKKTIDKISSINDSLINANYKIIDFNQKSFFDALTKNSEFDAAILVVPDHMHYELSIPLIRFSINLLVVKPLALYSKDVKEMIRLANKNKIINQVELHKRWDVANRYIKSEFIQKKNRRYYFD